MHVISGGETMANIKQQKKRVGTNEKARQANMAFKSSFSNDLVKQVLIASLRSNNASIFANLPIAR